MKTRSEALFFVTALAAALVVGGCSKSPEAAGSVPTVAAGGNVPDINVTEHVTTALNQNESLKGLDIKVETLKGDVRLMGMVDSQAQIDEAIRIARASEGAHTVHNELTIKK